MNCVGVLTKPDRIPAGEEAIWISRIQSGEKGGGIEYFSVKNPDSQDIRNGITYEQAREKEAEFFSTRAPWSTLEWLYKCRLGTDKLTRRLGQVLSNLISKRQVLFTFGLGVNFDTSVDFLSCRKNSTDYSRRLNRTYPSSRTRHHLSPFPKS
jgi:hypothetical protein